MKKLTKKKRKALALSIVEYLQEQELFYEVALYVNHQKWTSESRPGSLKKKTRYGCYFQQECMEAPMEYANPDTITMTFEGPLYDALNHGDGRVEAGLQELFGAYGLYFEQGYPWSLAAYPA